MGIVGGPLPNVSGIETLLKSSETNGFCRRSIKIEEYHDRAKRVSGSKTNQWEARKLFIQILQGMRGANDRSNREVCTLELSTSS